MFGVEKQKERARNRRQEKIMKKFNNKKSPRTELVHVSSDCERITINVSGHKFQTQVRTLKVFPNTLLGMHVHEQGWTIS